MISDTIFTKYRTLPAALATLIIALCRVLEMSAALTPSSAKNDDAEDTGVAPDSGAERVPLPPAREGEDETLRAFRVPSIITDRILLGR